MHIALLDTPDIKKAFDANTKWNVIEIVSNRYLGGMAEPSQRAKMAESGRRILRFVADNNFETATDPGVFESELRPIGPHAEAWLAAYRTTPEGQRFPGVTPALRSTLRAEEVITRLDFSRHPGPTKGNESAG